MAYCHEPGHPPSYANPTNFESGARCRTCSKVYDTDKYLDVRFCPAHSPDNDSEHARLGRLAVKLQDGFAEFCEERRSRDQWPEVSSYEHLCRGSEAEKQWWKWVCLFHLKCEYSLDELAEPLRHVMQGQQHTGMSPLEQNHSSDRI